jgi:hypothetical protein
MIELNRFKESDLIRFHKQKKITIVFNKLLFVILSVIIILKILIANELLEA